MRIISTNTFLPIFAKNVKIRLGNLKTGVGGDQNSWRVKLIDFYPSKSSFVRCDYIYISLLIVKHLIVDYLYATGLWLSWRKCDWLARMQI